MMTDIELATWADSRQTSVRRSRTCANQPADRSGSARPLQRGRPPPAWRRPGARPSGAAADKVHPHDAQLLHAWLKVNVYASSNCSSAYGTGRYGIPLACPTLRLGRPGLVDRRCRRPPNGRSGLLDVARTACLGRVVPEPPLMTTTLHQTRPGGEATEDGQAGRLAFRHRMGQVVRRPGYRAPATPGTATPSAVDGGHVAPAPPGEHNPSRWSWSDRNERDRFPFQARSSSRSRTAGPSCGTDRPVACAGLS
jgi:hypothetical protein